MPSRISVLEYITEWPHGVVRLGVVLCVAAAAALSVLKLDETLGLFDWRADQNGAHGYLERMYGEPFNLVGSRKVVEDARLWMPENARYRVVTGEDVNVEIGSRPQLAIAFLEFVLLPRRQVDSASATWVYCYGCAPSSLGRRFEVLSEGDNGIVFGRLRR